MKGETLSFDLCRQMAEAALEAQEELGVPVSMAVADRQGNLMFFFRFCGAILPSVEISQNKAYTAAVLGKSTREFGAIAQPGGEAFGINVTHPKLVIFGGGFPLRMNGETVGGLGISGGSVEEDEAVAARALAVFHRATGRTD